MTVVCSLETFPLQIYNPQIPYDPGLVHNHKLFEHISQTGIEPKPNPKIHEKKNHVIN